MGKEAYLPIIMIICGIAGGITAHITTDNKKFLDNDLIVKILYGIIASFLVPLFLNTISSELIEDIGKDAQSIYIFIGFCLIASLSSKIFITTLTGKIIALTQKQNEMEGNIGQMGSTVETLVLKNSELPAELSNDVHNANPPNKSVFAHESKQADINNVENKILFELGRSNKAFLSFDSLILNTRIPADFIDNGLKAMKNDGIITSTNIGSRTGYGINAAGAEKYKNLINSIEWQVIDISKLIPLINSKLEFIIKVESEEFKHMLQVYTADENIDLKVGDKIKAATADGNKVDIRNINKVS